MVLFYLLTPTICYGGVGVESFRAIALRLPWLVSGLVGPAWIFDEDIK